MTIVLDGVATSFIGPDEEYRGPVGVEGAFIYNDLRLNDRVPGEHRSGSYFYIGSIDGMDDAEVRDSRSTNSDMDGEMPGPSLYSGRTLVLSGTVRAFNLPQMRNMINELKMAFGELNESPLVFENADTSLSTQIMCRKLSKISILETQRDYRWFRDFQITLRSSDPRFYDVEETTQTIVPNRISEYARMYNRFGTVYNTLIDSNGHAVSVDENTSNVVNLGTYRTYPVITYNGEIKNPKIVNHTIDKSLILNGYVSEGETVVADQTPNVHTIYNDDGVNRFSMFDDSAEWVYLAPGGNIVEIQSDGFSDNCSVELSYRNAWL